VADPADIGPIQIGVYVQTADANRLSIGKSAEKTFTRTVERIRALGPVGAWPIQESKPLRFSFVPVRFKIRQ
jgi:hypothetical protein